MLRKSLGAFFGLSLFFTVETTQATVIPYNDFSLFDAATNSLTFIGFDTDTSGAPTGSGEIGTTYSSLGVVFPAGNLFTGLDDATDDRGWVNNTTSGSDRLFDATFTVGGVTAVGLDLCRSCAIPNGARLDAFDSGGGLLGSVMSDSLPLTFDFFGLTTMTPIDNILVTFIDPNGWAIGNLHFGSANVVPVPEPATVGLFALGLAGLGVMTRRRRKQDLAA